MANSKLFSRYAWMIDTIKRHQRLTLAQIGELWLESNFSDGKPLARRTFYNYREAIAELFGLSIEFCVASREYYIAGDEVHSPGGSVSDWLVNNASLSGMLSDTAAIADRIVLEQVPSARENLAPIIQAIKDSHPVQFTYHPFTRSRPSVGVVVEPYLIKLFKQRWYMAGYVPADDKIKTYALDRISSLLTLPSEFEVPPTFEPQEYFRNSFGIVVDDSEPRSVQLRATAKRAKYLRALPLHHSQQEMVNDEYSIFTYRMLLTPDLVEELMSIGPEVTVLAPVELRRMLANRLRATLAPYVNE